MVVVLGSRAASPALWGLAVCAGRVPLACLCVGEAVWIPNRDWRAASQGQKGKVKVKLLPSTVLHCPERGGKGLGTAHGGERGPYCLLRAAWSALEPHGHWR